MNRRVIADCRELEQVLVRMGYMPRYADWYSLEYEEVFLLEMWRMCGQDVTLRLDGMYIKDDDSYIFYPEWTETYVPELLHCPCSGNIRGDVVLRYTENAITNKIKEMTIWCRTCGKEVGPYPQDVAVERWNKREFDRVVFYDEDRGNK